jgi:hypothetical protein
MRAFPLRRACFFGAIESGERRSRLGANPFEKRAQEVGSAVVVHGSRICSSEHNRQAFAPDSTPFTSLARD